MKNVFLKTVVLFFIIVVSSCTSNDEDESLLEANGLTEESLLEANGLTAAINDLLPQEILDEMISLGMIINSGETPPNIEFAYLGSPIELIGSNRPSDPIGVIAENFLFQFTNQINEELTIELDYRTGPETGSGLGSFIVGDGNKFTVFSELTVIIGNDHAQAIYVFSGVLTEEGINDLKVANFMIDNFGNPRFIEIGEGRVFEDTDNFSEKTANFEISASENKNWLIMNRLIQE